MSYYRLIVRRYPKSTPDARYLLHDCVLTLAIVAGLALLTPLIRAWASYGWGL